MVLQFTLSFVWKSPQNLKDKNIKISDRKYDQNRNTVVVVWTAEAEDSQQQIQKNKEDTEAEEGPVTKSDFIPFFEYLNQSHDEHDEKKNCQKDQEDSEHVHKDRMSNELTRRIGACRDWIEWESWQSCRELL